MSDDNDDFDDFFVDKEAVFDSKIVREILHGKVQFTNEGEIIFGDSYTDLDTDKKMLTVLLSKRVLNLKLKIEDKLGPKELEEITGLPHGTVTTSLARLLKKRFVKKEESKYFVPNYALNTVRGFFNGK